MCAIKPEPRPSRTVKKTTPNPYTSAAGTVVFPCSHERLRAAVGLSSLESVRAAVGAGFSTLILRHFFNFSKHAAAPDRSMGSPDS